MRKSRPVVFLVLCLMLVPAFDAFGHGISSGGPAGRPIEVDNEQFSDQTVTTDDVVVITGKVSNRVNRPVTLVPHIYVDHDAMPPYTLTLAAIYPPLKDQSTWYFRVEHNLPDPLVLGPGETMPYEIKLYPLKAGSYHVHTYLLTDLGPHLGRGQIVIVAGQATPTAGEITQLYLPLTLGTAAVATLVFVMLRRTHMQPAREKAIRIYYAIKSSYETVWLSGIVFWLTAATYLPADKYTLAVGVTAVLAAVAFGGYVAVAARSRKIQRISAIATSAATVVLYLALQADDYPAIDNQFIQFNQAGLVPFLATVANALAAVLISALAIKERNKPAQITR